MIKNLAFSAFILMVIFINACAQNQEIQEKGILQGKIMIGPLCPVERIPPDSNCQPTEETYKAWPISVWTQNKMTKIGQIIPSADGSFRMELQAGNYVVDFDKQQPVIGKRNLPATVIIKSGETTNLDIDIDTGIR